MRACSNARDRAAKGREGNSIATHEIDQRLTFNTVRVQGNIHRIAVIQMPTIVNRALPENGDRQRTFKCLLEESLEPAGLRDGPATGAGVANE